MKWKPKNPLPAWTPALGCLPMLTLVVPQNTDSCRVRRNRLSGTASSPILSFLLGGFLVFTCGAGWAADFSGKNLLGFTAGNSAKERGLEDQFDAHINPDEQRE